jgi:hypothetical protein
MASRGSVHTALVSSFLFAACGTNVSQPTPAAPAKTESSIGPTVSSVLVGTAGDRPPTLRPGETLQLFAQAKYADGTTSDVTNVALWQSSNPVIATVSSQGVLTGAAEGAVDVSAIYQTVAGSLHSEIRNAGCDATTVAPVALTFSAFGTSSGIVQVRTPLSDCRWTARSDADWLRFQFDPGRSGSGNFTYEVPANSNPAPRSAHILVTVAGVQVVHTVTQERPASCSYVVKPENRTFTASGGNGFFDVVTTPPDCTWRASVPSFFGVRITGGTGATGAGRVTYTADPNPYTFPVDATISVAGLSGANPAGVHKVHVASR